jgi:hypothetical protein
MLPAPVEVPVIPGMNTIIRTPASAPLPIEQLMARACIDGSVNPSP